MREENVILAIAGDGSAEALPLADDLGARLLERFEASKGKLVVHGGRCAIADDGALSGVDVIIAHRLLESAGDDSMVVTEAAQQELRLPLEHFSKSEEAFDGIGSVTTYVYVPFLETVRCAVKREYADVATNPGKGFHFHTGRKLAAMLGYTDEMLAGIPEPAIERLAGTGNPFALGPLHAGETVVELGCGAGMDTLIASRMVGPQGRVVSIDMTPEMLEAARAAASEAGATNIDFHLGYIEEIPLPDASADVIISNGVINLAPDKKRVFREMRRVLKDDGRLQIGDIVVQKAVPEGAKRNIDLWAG
ncbi:MAG TPA: methyltransferase domain-containing protein [Thermoanaerobaculia bacterium]|jgi:2-polyprenyl-3-methyl-5-hydroxy-6-metoxy-1,4-benzoquinol methylase